MQILTATAKHSFGLDKPQINASFASHDKFNALY